MTDYGLLDYNAFVIAMGLTPEVSSHMLKSKAERPLTKDAVLFEIIARVFGSSCSIVSKATHPLILHTFVMSGWI